MRFRTSAPRRPAFSRRLTCRRSCRPGRARAAGGTLLSAQPLRYYRGAIEMSSSNGSDGPENTEYKFVTYETLDEGRIARIMLNRPDARNAQHRGLLVELDECFMRAEADDTVRVVILGGNGKMFSSGHDLGSKSLIEEMTPGPTQHPTMTTHGGTRKGAEKLMLQEWHFF